VLDSDEQLAKRVLDEEDAINELQMEVDDRVVQLLALHQLMAMDSALRPRCIAHQTTTWSASGPGCEHRAGLVAHLAASAA